MTHRPASTWPERAIRRYRLWRRYACCHASDGAVADRSASVRHRLAAVAGPTYAGIRALLCEVCRYRRISAPCERLWSRSKQKKIQYEAPTHAETRVGYPTGGCSVADNRQSQRRLRLARASVLAADLCREPSARLTASRYLQDTASSLRWRADPDGQATTVLRSHADPACRT